eukprot:CAMPEP_0185791074 /NCGR_PEP_ID=MMETSP1174-20130828/158170_1 /TAXON_ID=35687 /ORGANISM="Dictyocha speculum, Strain CCMP1381" /LENGTH=342 /DNA_ID=CAMNT_0028485977 /DNA_START=1201 /DNA_END=2229 /DNA_ORIENTATION=-
MVERSTIIPYSRLDMGDRFACGGGGVVYIGKYCGQTVAIKKSYADMIAQDTSEFMHEAAMLASIRHPCITQFHGISMFEGELLLVMEYVPRCLLTICEEHTLEEIRPSGLGLIDAHRLAVELAQTLEYLHSWEHGIVHRDLKPANILLSKDEFGFLHIKICDLGMAKMTDWDSSRLLFRGGEGTPGFSPPEVAETDRGVLEVADITKWDIYSLGMMCWYLWTLKLPFDDTNMHDIGQRVINGDRPDPHAGHTPMPCEFIQVIEKMWAQDPSQRPTAGESVALLNQQKLTERIVNEDEKQQVREREYHSNLLTAYEAAIFDAVRDKKRCSNAPNRHRTHSNLV